MFGAAHRHDHDFGSLTAASSFSSAGLEAIETIIGARACGIRPAGASRDDR
jgi:hypothetical protein